METKKKLLFVDIETYSDVDLKSCGVYKYAESPAFEIQLLGYAYGEDAITVIDLAQGEKIPDNVLLDLVSFAVNKVAHNANFERVCLAKWTALTMHPAQWICTAVRASTLGLPRSLEEVGKALELDEDEKKMAIGKRLMLYFAKPCLPTKTNGGRTRNLPRHDPAKWELYKEYNRQDVVTERIIYNKLKHYPETTKTERHLWALDQLILEGGVKVDTQLVDTILSYAEEHKNSQKEQATRISGIDNPNSLPQIRRWLNAKGINPDKLDKASVASLIEILADDEPEVVEFLSIRQELGKTSVAKYDAMARAKCSDNRVRGMLQFYGAERTGRWAGRIVQLQNLPKNSLKDLDAVRALVKAGEFELIELLYPSLMYVFSQLIRTAFIADEGKTFVVADYSAIEARVIAWLAGEKWRIDVFNGHGKIYEASYSRAFKVPVESVKKGSPERAKGKIMELALGYGGGVNALKAFGADEMGLNDDELQRLVDSWRGANRNIITFWKKTENAMRNAIANPGSVVKLEQGLSFKLIDGVLFITLPSGRAIAYWGARLVKTDGKTEIRYMGKNQTTQKWGELATYGGKLAENITQAVARDCLAAAMLALDEGYSVRFHVHDEVITEVEEETAEADMARIRRIMTLSTLDWVKGLPLTADAFITPYYCKD